MSQTHRCPVCATPTRINFLFEHESAIFLVREQYPRSIGLEDLACRLYCVQCGWQSNGVLRNVNIDKVTLKMTGGTFIPHE